MSQGSLSLRCATAALSGALDWTVAQLRWASGSVQDHDLGRPRGPGGWQPSRGHVVSPYGESRGHISHWVHSSWLWLYRTWVVPATIMAADQTRRILSVRWE